MDNKLKKGKFSAVTIPMLPLVIVVIALTIPRIKRLIAQRRADREEDAE